MVNRSRATSDRPHASSSASPVRVWSWRENADENSSIEDGLTVHEGPDAVREALREGCTVWIDLWGKCPEAERLLGPDGLNLHPLAIEDIFEDGARPKVEEFADFLYVQIHAPEVRHPREGRERSTDLESAGPESARLPDSRRGPVSRHDPPRSGPTELGRPSELRPGEAPPSEREPSPRQRFELHEVDVLIGPKWVLTHHSGTSPAISAVAAEVATAARYLRRGPAWTAHAIIDHIVDDFVSMLDGVEDDLDQLEDNVLQGRHRDPLPRIFFLKRRLQRIRRISAHQKEVLHRLSRGEFRRIPEALLPFFRDVHDHFSRFTDLTEGYREVLASSYEAHLAVQSNKANIVMKTLTLATTMFMPLTFIAGIYGMNFRHMPELEQPWAYPAVLVLMGAIATAIFFYYHRKGWL